MTLYRQKKTNLVNNDNYNDNYNDEKQDELYFCNKGLNRGHFGKVSVRVGWSYYYYYHYMEGGGGGVMGGALGGEGGGYWLSGSQLV